VSDVYPIDLRSVDGGPTAVASSGPFSVLTDRPAAGGGRGLGFNGGQHVDGDFPERGKPSSPITVDIEVEGLASDDRLRELVRLVDTIAEIPNSIRGGTSIELRNVQVVGRAS